MVERRFTKRYASVTITKRPGAYTGRQAGNPRPWLQTAGKIPVYASLGKHYTTAMESWDRITSLRHIGAALGRGALFAIILPLLPVLLFGLPLTPTLALIGSGLLIEYGAAPVGIALGLSPLSIFYILMCTETGIFLGLFDIFDTIGHTYAPVTRFLENSRQIVHRSATVERYGILSLIPCVILLGVYINAPVSWVLGWREDHALLITLAGYCGALAITIFATIGLLRIYFPGLVHP